MYRPGRVLVYLLIAAHVAVAAALIALVFQSDLRVRTPGFGWQGRWFAIACVTGFSLAQTALAVWWLMMRRSLNWPMRATAWVGVVALWIRVMAVSNNWPEIMGACLYVGFTVAMLWVAVPWRMFAMARSENRSFRQFDLRQMLMLVLAAACTSAFAHWCHVAGGSRGAAAIGVFALCGGMTATVAFWACRDSRGMFWRVPVLIVSVATLTLMTACWGVVWPDWWHGATMYATEVIVIAATMSVLHVAARQPARLVDVARPASESTASRDPQFG